MTKERFLDVLALLLALSGLMIAAWVSDDVFERIPHTEDEFAYLWQAEVMAEGQISLPSPEKPNAFLVPFVVDHEGQRFAKYPPGWPAALSIGALLEPGAEIVVMLPNYMQIWGIANNFRLHVKTFSLRGEFDWAVDLDELNSNVTDKTKLIAVCNPDNPTGHIMTPLEMDAVVTTADRVGAWLIADEVYAGAERTTDEVTPSFWGRYERVLAIGSMSKAYGMPGLRIGWIVTAEDMADEIWARQEYVTIGSAMLDNKLAAYALSPEVRPRILRRTRDYVRKGYGIFDSWAKSHGDLYAWVPPQAAPIVFVRYNADINSTDLCMRLIHEYSVEIVPGDHFGLDGHLRISFGLPEDYLLEGLDRVYQAFTSSG